MFRVLASIQTIGEDAIKTKFFANPTYVGDPMNIVRILNAKGAQEILITDIESTKSNQINLDLISNISEESTVPVTYSGGINNVSQVLNLMALGVERIGINTLFHENSQRVKEISEIIGSSSIAFSLDLECDEKLNWYPLVLGGTKKVDRDINQILSDAISLKIGEIHIKIKNAGSGTAYDGRPATGEYEVDVRERHVFDVRPWARNDRRAEPLERILRSTFALVADVVSRTHDHPNIAEPHVADASHRRAHRLAMGAEGKSGRQHHEWLADLLHFDPGERQVFKLSALVGLDLDTSLALREDTVAHAQPTDGGDGLRADADGVPA